MNTALNTLLETFNQPNAAMVSVYSNGIKLTEISLSKAEKMGKTIRQLLQDLFESHQGQTLVFSGGPQKVTLDISPEVITALNNLSASSITPLPSTPALENLSNSHPAMNDSYNAMTAKFYEQQYKAVCDELARMRQENQHLQQENLQFQRERATWEGKKEMEVLLAKTENSKGFQGLSQPEVLDSWGKILEKVLMGLGALMAKKEEGNGLSQMDQQRKQYLQQMLNYIKDFNAEEMRMLAYCIEYFHSVRTTLHKVYTKLKSSADQASQAENIIL